VYIPRPESSRTEEEKTSAAPESATPTGVADLLEGLMADGNHSGPHAPLSVTLEVHPNAELVVGEQNVVEGVTHEEHDLESQQQAADRVKRVARALEVSGDLGVWAQWVRREVARE
jgi:hypothetical protein